AEVISAAAPSRPSQNEIAWAAEPDERRKLARRLQRRTIEVKGSILVAVDDGYMAGKAFGVCAREVLAGIVAFEVNLTQLESAGVYGTTFPGFMIPFGSSSFLIPR